MLFGGRSLFLKGNNMQNALIQFNKDTGRIYQLSMGPNTEENYESFNVEEYKDFAFLSVKLEQQLTHDYYVDENYVVKPKMAFPALTVTNGLIENIPYGATVVWPDYESTEEFDGSVEIESNVSGKFKFTFDSPKHVLHEIEVVYSV